MYAADNHIIFLQFLIHVLHLGGRCIPADTETGDRIITSQHLLKLVIHPVTDRQGCYLFLIELLQRDDAVFILQEGDRFFIQLGSEPCSMRRVQPFGQTFRIDRVIIVQPGNVFILQNLDDLRFYLFSIQNAIFQCFLHGCEVIERCCRCQKNVIAGQQCLHGWIIGFTSSSPFHRQSIGKAQSSESEFFLQQAGDDSTRHGDRPIACLVQRRDIQMPGHHTGITVIDVTSERQQFHTVQACPVMMNGRQRIMGVFSGIAMPGEMLGNGQDTLPFQPAGIRQTFVGYRLRILAEGVRSPDCLYCCSRPYRVRN